MTSSALGRGARRLALLLAALLPVGLAAVPAHADVTVSPTLVLFDGEAGTKAITVKNTGTKEQIYRVSLINFRMAPDGGMSVVTTPAENEHFATGMVRFTPHELTLVPGGSDVVRLQVVNPRPGEYRTHVIVQQVPDIDPLQAPPFERREGVSMDLQAVFGIAVPLIIRQGNPSVAVSFGAAHLTSLPDGMPGVVLRVERSGERSIRGALSLRRNGKEIALIDGISIYAPTPYRDVVLRLAAEEVAQLRDSRLEASFNEPEEIHNPVAASAVIHFR
jgi:P pilus assembly chaperone PapD